MKKIILFASVVLLSACTPLSYDEVKAREEYCKGKGLAIEHFTMSYDRNQYTRITGVFCKDDKGNRYDSEDIRKSNAIIFPVT